MSAKQNNEISKLGFEEAIKQLGSIVSQIEQGQDAAPLIAVEDDQVELVELLLEQFAGREGDQRQLIDGRAVLLLRRAENGEMHEVDSGVGLQHVTPSAFAGVRLARDQKHAQILAHAFHGQDGTVVDIGELAGRGIDLDAHDIGTGVVDLHGNLDGLADANGLLRRLLALMGDGQDRGSSSARLGLGNLHLDRLNAADNAEARRGQHLKPAVELARFAGEQGVHRRVEAEPGGNLAPKSE